MKKAILCCFVFAIIAGSARAADLQAPVLKAAPLAVYDWSGIYVGANAGYARSNKCWTAFVALGPRDEGCHEPKGFMGGAQAGFNWQSGAWVAGLEVQSDWGGLSASKPSLTFQNISSRTRIDALALFTGRLGYAWDRVLLYVKGGGALVRDQYDIPATDTGQPFQFADDQFRWGWTVGGGLEYGFTPNWSAAVEYNFADFGKHFVEFHAVATGASVSPREIRQDMQLVTVRLNFRWPPRP